MKYPASRGLSIFLDKSTYLGRSKGLCAQGSYGDKNKSQTGNCHSKQKRNVNMLMAGNCYENRKRKINMLMAGNCHSNQKKVGKLIFSLPGTAIQNRKTSEN